MQICVLGTGCVGLVTAAILADKENGVYCVDEDTKKIENLNKGTIHITEPGLDKVIQRGTHPKFDKLKFTTNIKQAIEDSNVVFICEETCEKENGDINLDKIKQHAKTIAEYMTGYTCVVIKSTVPIGTCKTLKKILQKYKKKNVTFDIVSNPDFIREGTAIHDAYYADRIIIGSDNLQATQIMMELYEPFERRMILMDVNSAEITKLANNAFLATKISFINAMSLICDQTDANIQEVARGIGADSRIGEQFFNASFGYGSTYLIEDIKALTYQTNKMKIPMNIVEATAKTNDYMIKHFIDRIRTKLGGFQGKQVTLWGVAFKYGTDDIRKSRAMIIADTVIKEGGYVKAYDAMALRKAKEVLPQLAIFSTPYEAAFKTNVVVIATCDPIFSQVELIQLKEYVETPIMFDGVNCYDPFEIQKTGWEYYSIGRN